MIQKQTKLWKTKDGRRIRICDMDDRHLLNTIRFLDRKAKEVESAALYAGHAFLNTLQGEMAQDCLENELDAIEQDGVEPHEICPLYNNLVAEALRRDLDLFVELPMGAVGVELI